MPSIKKEI
ncbi:uncharacterized protein FRV6_08175 [Fusarium oxysporum]|uniref:Uncharacterized protein n=1 Tax=Fusarium oxysporum TaxID=5507 RepID=A0A2H3T5N6_FUSOX|nr:uncharacterized protein FRV6_08175 [Fusarium oxysporum]